MGKGGGDVLPTFIKRFGQKEDAYVSISVPSGKKWMDIVNRYFSKKKKKNNNNNNNKNMGYIGLSDMMQTIENFNFDKGMTGERLYQHVLKEIVSISNLIGFETMISCVDNNKFRNLPKDMVYFSIGGKRRKGAKIMEVDDGDIVMKDDNIPRGDDWRGMKMNSQTRKQINWYFTEKFKTESKISKITKPICVVLDNCVLKKDLYGSDPDETPYYAIECQYNNKGERTSIQRQEASGISEGEMSMGYFIMKYSKNDIVCFTTDQDIIPILLVDCNRRFIKNNGQFIRNVYVVMRKRKGKREKDGKILQKMDKETKKKKPILERVCDIFDMNQIYKYIIHYYNTLKTKENKSIIIPHPIEREVLLFLFAGGDNSEKIFHRVGFSSIEKEYIQHAKRYKNLFKPIQINGLYISDEEEDDDDDDDDGGGEDSVVKLPLNCIDIDFKQFKKFALSVYKKKYTSKTFTKKIKEGLFDKPEFYIVLRQIMFQFLMIMNINILRMKLGQPVGFDPYQIDKNQSIWGYKKSHVEGSPFETNCTSAKSVSKDFFKKIIIGNNNNNNNKKRKRELGSASAVSIEFEKKSKKRKLQ